MTEPVNAHMTSIVVEGWYLLWLEYFCPPLKFLFEIIVNEEQWEAGANGRLLMSFKSPQNGLQG